MKHFSKNWKLHLTFGGAFLLILAAHIVMNMTAGQPFRSAMGNAFLDIRPMEYAMFILVWYACARYRQGENGPSLFTMLNLGRSNR